MSDISTQVWDMKYRLKAPDGTPLDRDLADSWARVALALSEAEPPDQRTARVAGSMTTALTVVDPTSTAMPYAVSTKPGHTATISPGVPRRIATVAPPSPLSIARCTLASTWLAIVGLSSRCCDTTELRISSIAVTPSPSVDCCTLT